VTAVQTRLDHDLPCSIPNVAQSTLLRLDLHATVPPGGSDDVGDRKPHAIRHFNLVAGAARVGCRSGKSRAKVIGGG
jgi:hypothetical protein